MTSFRNRIRVRVLAGLVVIAATAACQISNAAPILWSGTGADQNWSTPGNWVGNVPPGIADDVKFSDLGGSGTVGVVDNIVDANRSNLSLQFAYTNNTVGHTTLINPGVTLTLTGSGGLLNGNETQSDVRDTSTITGTGGTLVVSNTAANINVRQAATVMAANRTTLDLSSLDTFNATVARVLVGVVGTSTFNRATGRLLLARTNSITTSGAAPQLDVSDSVGSSNNGGGSTLSLGQTNAFFTDSITVGRGRETTGNFSFNSAFTSPSVFIRGTNGLSSRVSSWTVGDASTQTGTITCRGTVNVTTGTLDAMVNTLILGQPSLGTGDGSQSQGTFLMGAGNLDVNTLILGNVRTNNATSAQAAFGLTGGSTLIVHSNLVLQQAAGGSGAPNCLVTLSATNSTIIANTITNAGTGTNTINLVTSSLTVSNQMGNISQPIGTLFTQDSTYQLASVIGAPSVTVSNLFVNGSSDVINILSVPPGTGQYPLIVFTVLGNEAPDFTIGTLPPGFQGYISNNTSSVDLVITNSTIHTDTWRGNVNGNWDTATLNWFAGAPVAYQQNDPVIFDDTVTGTRNVNLTTVLTPDGVSVANSSGDYTFSGAGKLSGATGLTKSGTSTLTLNETGGDDFAGGISVEAGTLVLDNSGSAISGGLTISSGATAQIGNNDANGNLAAPVVNNGSLVFDRSDNVALNTGISGAGALVKLGAGSLTLSNAMAYTGDTPVFQGTLALAGSASLASSANVVISNATFDVTAVASGASSLNNFSFNDSVLNLGSTNASKPPITATFVNMGGSGNTINVSALPPIAAYPATITLIQTANGFGGFNATLGTLPSASPAFVGSIHESGDGLSVQLVLTSGPSGLRTSVLWSGADVPNLNTNWSDAQNWQTPGAPVAGDNVIFNNTAAQTASAINTPGGGITTFIPDFVDNIVDANFTLSTLVYTNYGNTYHNTFIKKGNVLSVTNSALTIGAADTGASVQTGFVNVIGTNATLSVNNTNANIQIWLGNTATGGSQATLDLSALDTFSSTNSRLAVGAAINNAVNRVSGILYLARTNMIAAAFQTTTQDAGTTGANGAIVVGDANSNAGSASSLYLGLVNTINADTIGIGRQKATGHFLFNPIYANIAPYPTVTIQGYSSNRVSSFEVGNSAGNTGTTTLTADTTFGGGIVNALIDTLNVGRASSGSGSGNTTGTLNFDAGTINANTVNIGLQPASGTKVGIGTLGVGSNTVIGAAANLTVNGNLTLGIAGGGAGATTTSGTLNITNGTVSANAIVIGTNSVSAINLIGGRLTVATSIGNASAALGTLSLSSMNTPDNSNTVLQVPASLTPSVVVNNLNIDGLGSTTNLINISSVAAITTPMELPVIQYANLINNGGTFNIGLGTLPPGYAGYLTNDTTLSAIAVVITTAAPPSVPPTIQKISIVGGNIVISGTNNVGTTGTYHVLTSTNVALPLTNWTVLTNGSFDGTGNFNVTNAIDSTKRDGFFILQVP